VISSARVAGVPLQGFCWELALPYEEDALNKIATETRAAGLEIITAKGATYFGIGAALARIVCAILRDEHAVLAVSSLVPESMGLGEVSLSLPSIIIATELLVYFRSLWIRQKSRRCINPRTS
jgi:L-lactate dehydrogenase